MASFKSAYESIDWSMSVGCERESFITKLDWSISVGLDENCSTRS